MDIYRFINSIAIRDYLRRENYEFNSLEAAWLIYQCKHISLEEKYSAWKELIATMPDCEIEERMNCRQRASLHELINEYITILQKQYELFKVEEAHAVYQYSFYCTDDVEWCENFEGVFSSESICWQKIEEDKDLGIECIQICKRYIDSGKTVTATYKPDKTLMNIDSNRLTDEEYDVIHCSFDGLWFDFPVPFKKGDIVIETGHPGPRDYVAEEGPLVLLGVASWEIERNNVRMVKNFHGDNTDMTAWGYFQDADGRIFHDSMFNYMDLEYYEGPYEDPKRLLVALSNYIKGEMGLDLLLTTYRKVIMDEMSKDVMLDNWYTEEGLIKAGLRTVD